MRGTDESFLALLRGFKTEAHWQGRRLQLNWQGHRLSSVFQPIVSFSHSRIVAHEALLRAQDSRGVSISPASLFMRAQKDDQIIALDRASRLMHIQNSRDQDGCFFLNLQPSIFESLQDESCFEIVQGFNKVVSSALPRYVIEIVEDEARSAQHIEHGIEMLRKAGFGIAIDDFGTGYSNFDRIWRLRPEVVKLDRSFIAQAQSGGAARRMLERIVGMLHEAGALVLIEGIETVEQARIARDTNADFGQGWFFSLPAPDPETDGSAIAARLEEVWRCPDWPVASSDPMLQLRRSCESSLFDLASRLVRGERFEQAAQSWLLHPHALSAYLLDADGVLVGTCLESSAQIEEADGFMLGREAGTRWSRAGYFLEAMRKPGEVQVSRPYRSRASGRLCATLSVNVICGGQRIVVCGDADWGGFEPFERRRARRGQQ